jgi:hypothetical protein
VDGGISHSNNTREIVHVRLVEPSALQDERCERPRCARNQYPDSAWDRTRRRWAAIHASAASSEANGVTIVGLLSGMLTSTPNEPSSKGTTL